MTVTIKDKIGMVANNVSGVIPVVVTALSTLDTIYPATEGKVIAVVGILYSETNTTNLTFYSGNTAYVTPEFGANSGLGARIGAPLFVTQPGEALKLAASVEISSMTVYVQVDDAYKFYCK